MSGSSVLVISDQNKVLKNNFFLIMWTCVI